MTALFASKMAQRSILDGKYGITGDGLADDTSGLTALLAASSRGECVVLPPGEYRITSTIEMPEGIWLKGFSSPLDVFPQTKIVFDPPGGADSLFELASPSEGGYAAAGVIEGIAIEGDGTANSEYAISYSVPRGFKMRDCFISGFKFGVRLRSGINCSIAHTRIHGIDETGSACVLLDSNASFNGTTATIEQCSLRVAEWGVIGQTDGTYAYNRVRLLNNLIESTYKGAVDQQQGCRHWYYEGNETENICQDDDADSSVFKIGVNGTHSDAALAYATDNQIACNNGSNIGTRICWEVDKGSVMARGGEVNSCGEGLFSQTSNTGVLSFRDIRITNTDHGVFGWGRGIDRPEDIVIDNVGYSDLMLRPNGNRVVSRFVELSGASTVCTLNIPRRAVIRGVAFRNKTELSITGTLVAALSGGNTNTLYNSFPSGADNVRGRLLIGHEDSPDIGSGGDAFAYVTATALTQVTFTATSMSGTIMVAVAYDYYDNPGEPW